MLPNQKVYHGVLEEIRIFIESNNLNPGDKLPSERELSETLGTGRSSVREALRALELLGIIETRHGEGTFLSTYRPFQTVEILASFILSEKTTKESLISTKKLIEKEAAKLAYNKLEDRDIAVLNEIICDLDTSSSQKDMDFFNYLLMKTENVLLMKIWQLIAEFSQTFEKPRYDAHVYQDLIHLYLKKEYSAIEELFVNQASSK
ncbi:FadR/GntR family transcriptional regulator [Oceanobacillus salinisoli]|uniref:FadR/GntR family transcriptional regulator n=1 Tax=Oceanobacillus salinisoli TaxID=2678611 RepID=UPI002F353E85